MNSVIRGALRSKSSVCALQRSHGLPIYLEQLGRCFSTEAEHPPQNSTAPPQFFRTDNSGLTYARLTCTPSGIRKYMLKTDIIHFLESCKLTLEDVKVDYNRSFFPVAMMLQFPSRNAYDKAIKEIVAKGRLYKLEMASRDQWDYVTPYDGKTILIQGIPRSAVFEDVERVLTGCEYDSSSVNIFLRPGAGTDAIKMATVRFPSRTQAMNAFITKNGTICQNSRILVQVLQ
ncbi:uncharacterized protein LOC133294233 [Gastrolobium bilobum]|uniref:uncharacterized protein LOC133294233 n=1 Tax=Gastrolobium bilobum TaxID=150636 RepID=UPI002AAF339B|nr:uncharacterized protein LOC133294233 [Gastrolobium bilobum]